MNNSQSSIEHILVKIFIILAGVVFIGLFIDAFLYSYINIDLQDEHVYKVSDNISVNLIALIASILIALLICIKGNKFTKRINSQIIALVMAIVGTILSLLWVIYSETEPLGDPASICKVAIQFSEGNYTALEKGGYIAEYPHQLGIVTLLRILFFFFGKGNYFSFQVLNCIAFGVIIYFSYLVASRLSNNRVVEVITVLMVFLCLPLYLYTSYVYGEILSIALSAVTLYLFLSLLEHVSVRHIVALIFSVICMLCVRKNTMILIVAILGVTIVRWIIYRKKEYLAIVFVIAIALALQYSFISAIYDKHRPKDASEMPSILWVAMGTCDVALGTDERAGYAGWYNGLNHDLFESCDYDAELAKGEARKYIANFIDYCIDNPKYFIDFYTRKISSQWIAPMHQAVVMNTSVTEIDNKPRLIQYIYNSKKAWNLMDGYMNVYQNLIYFSIAYLLIDGWKNKRNLNFYVGLIMVYGSFIFLIIWEAKARYTLPYTAMLIPYSSVGLYQFISYIFKRIWYYKDNKIIDQ